MIFSSDKKHLAVLLIILFSVVSLQPMIARHAVDEKDDVHQMIDGHGDHMTMTSHGCCQDYQPCKVEVGAGCLSGYCVYCITGLSVTFLLPQYQVDTSDLSGVTPGFLKKAQYLLFRPPRT